MNEMKLKKGLVREVEEKREAEKRQRELRKKHNIDDGVIVVEKNNSIKFVTKLIISAAKTICAIGIVLLGAIGLISVIYPNVRMELFKVLNEIINEVLIML